MKRFHVHVAVDNLNANIRFYSAIFGAEPSVLKPDYAKWMMEDPRINFAISQRGAKAGLDHLGFQVDTEEELTTLRSRVGVAEIATRNQPDATCCYARSDKYWTSDPQGIAWETYHTLDNAEIYGVDARPETDEAGACCAPSSSAQGRKHKGAAKCC
ncbi:MAG TPA: ArsI/CadI family heavy metal resistance metalloenzyme [Nitrosospira sp.]|nr:ArsI/CadI family heavy metal resistance metalloenzyme [Nitrosospira sp.]